MSGPTAQTPDSPLTSVGPVQCVEIHQTLILRQLPLRAHVFLRVCVCGHTPSAKLGRRRGWGKTGGCGSNLHSKSHQTQVEPLERRVGREDGRRAGAAVESVLIGSHLSSATTES